VKRRGFTILAVLSLLLCLATLALWGARLLGAGLDRARGGGGAAVDAVQV